MDIGYWLGIVASLIAIVGAGQRFISWLMKNTPSMQTPALRQFGTFCFVIGGLLVLGVGIYLLATNVTRGSYYRADNPLPPDQERERVKSVHSLTSSTALMSSPDAKSSVIKAIPTIKGGVKGRELSSLTALLTSPDARDVIIECAPYIIYPLQHGEVENMTGLLNSSDAAICVKVLYETQQKAMGG